MPIDSAPEYSEGYCTPVIPGPTGSTAYLGSVGATLTIRRPRPSPTGYPVRLILMESPF